MLHKLFLISAAVISVIIVWEVLKLALTVFIEEIVDRKIKR